MLKVLVTGSTGLVGTALVDFLVRRGCQVTRLVRRPGDFAEAQVLWDIAAGSIDAHALEGLDVVVHLAGESIAGGRWTDERKKRILNSRVKSTTLLVNTLATLKTPPQVMLCASAVGYYGNGGDRVLTEVSAPGHDFLAHTCQQWEAACQPARNAGIRVVNTRFGLVLSPQGGALKAMYWPFKLGLAGRLGTGQQYMSWIALDDLVAALYHLMNQPMLTGPVNMTTPHPVTNAHFTTAMRHVLIPPFLPMHYWTPPVPAWALKLLLGEMGEQLLLASQRVLPVRLQESGFQFRYADIESALGSML